MCSFEIHAAANCAPLGSRRIGNIDAVLIKDVFDVADDSRSLNRSAVRQAAGVDFSVRPRAFVELIKFRERA